MKKTAIFFGIAVLLLGFAEHVVACADHPTIGTLKRPSGTSISYQMYEEKDDMETVLLVHCWACNRHYWDKQLPELVKKYRVVTLDLPGHGESTTKQKKWTFDAMAEEIVAVARELKLKKFTVVGHSMGGPLALEVAKAMPEQVNGVVCVDTLHNVEQKFNKEDFVVTEKNFEESISAFIPLMVHPQSEKSIAPWLVSQSLKTNRAVAVSLWDYYFKADFGQMMKDAKVPIQCVNAAPYNEHSQQTREDINRKYGDYKAIQMKDVGHFPMIEKPKAFNKLLIKAIESITP